MFLYRLQKLSSLSTGRSGPASSHFRFLLPAVLLLACGEDEAQDSSGPPDTSVADVADSSLDADDSSDFTPDLEISDADVLEVADVVEDVAVDADAGEDTDADADSAEDVDAGEDADAAEDADIAEDADAEDADADAAEDADLAEDTDAEADVICERVVTAEFFEQSVELWHRAGADSQTVFVPVELSGEPCGELRLLTSGTWFDARWTGAGIEISTNDATGAGLHTAEVALVHDGLAQLLGTIEITAHVFPAPSPDAERKVLFIGVDGVRSDAFLVANTPTFDALRALGAWTLEGRTHGGNTDSSAGWTTLYTGVEPDRHLVTGNGAMAARDWSYRSFAWRARNEMDLNTAMVAHWTPTVTDLHEDDAFDRTALGSDAFVATTVAEWLRDGDEDLMLTHFDDVDHTGHGIGFSPAVPGYVAAIELVDEQVLEIIDGLLERPSLEDEAWLVVVVTDHGGEGTSHGAINLPNQRIPLIFSGSIDLRGELTTTVTQMDVKETILAWLGAAPLPAGTTDGRARLDASEPVDADGAPPGTEVACEDRIDADGDTLIDCLDSDCNLEPRCAAVCADLNLGSATGDAASSGNNGDEDTDYAITCARLPGASDASLRWTAPSAGDWLITTLDSDFDTILAIYDGACSRPTDQLACNDDFDGTYQSGATISAESGDVFTIVVSGFDGATGDWVVNISPAP